MSHLYQLKKNEKVVTSKLDSQPLN